MRLVMATIPDDPQQIPQWLERQIVGPELRDLVEELSALTLTTTRITLDELLATQKTTILEFGLKSLSDSQTTTLLKQPKLLYDLQDWVFAHGGAYWDQLPQSERITALTQAAWPNILAQLPAEAEPIVPLAVVKSTRRANPWLVSLATAAAVLLVVFGVEQFRGGPAPVTTTVAWGWAKPDALPKTSNSKEYLNALAQAGQEWFNKTPQSRDELAQRLHELRQGCSTLLLAEHQPLNEEQRQWLRDKCRNWAKKFDEALMKLEAGENLGNVQIEVDQVVQTLVNSLNEQARNS